MYAVIHCIELSSTYWRGQGFFSCSKEFLFIFSWACCVSNGQAKATVHGTGCWLGTTVIVLRTKMQFQLKRERRIVACQELAILSLHLTYFNITWYYSSSLQYSKLQRLWVCNDKVLSGRIHCSLKLDQLVI